MYKGGAYLWDTTVHKYFHFSFRQNMPTGLYIYIIKLSDSIMYIQYITTHSLHVNRAHPKGITFWRERHSSMAHGVTEQRNQLRGTETDEIMIQGKDVRMNTMVMMNRKRVGERSLKADKKEEEVGSILEVMMSLIRNGKHLVGLADLVLIQMMKVITERKGVGEKSLKADKKEEEVGSILVVMMSLIRNGKHLVGLVDLVFIPMMKAIAERKQKWTNQNTKGETGTKRRNMDPHILMTLKKMMTLVVLTVIPRLSLTVVVITLTLKVRRVKIEIGGIGEDFVLVLVLLNSQMLLGHWERVVCQ